MGMYLILPNRGKGFARLYILVSPGIDKNTTRLIKKNKIQLLYICKIRSGNMICDVYEHI